MNEPRKAPQKAAASHAPAGSDTLVLLRPIGRGNWETVELRLRGRRAPPPMMFTQNQRIELAGQEFRVAKIMSC